MAPYVFTRRSTDWSTADELFFLEHLGTWTQSKSQPEGVHGVSRKSLLRRYRAAMRLRKRWGSLDAQRIRAAVREMEKEA